MGLGGSKKKPAEENKLRKHEHHSVIDNPGRIHEFYDVERRRLGEGSFAAVFKACNKSTGFERAVKVMSKNRRSNIPRFYNEIALLKSVDHPNIVKYYESFQDPKFVYIVTEVCRGMEFADMLVKINHMTEVQAAITMQQVLRAITYMHKVGVMHRDLKPENMMFDTEDEIEDNTVKIVDFGLAIKFEFHPVTGEADVITSKCGAPYYVAPQVLAGHYNYMADIWSCGVLMYILLCGYPPFYGDSDADILAKVRLGNYHFNQADWKHISNEAKDLIRALLKINPADRITSVKALATPWLKLHAPRSEELPLKNSLVYYLKSFSQANRLKRCALFVIAGNLSDDELKNSIESFNNMDVEGDGMLGYEEIRNGLKKAGVKDIPKELPEILQQMDSDGSGQVEFTEFLAATIDRKYITEDNVWSAFRCFDQNGDGKISQAEMYRVLNTRSGEGEETVSPQECVALMRELSEDGDTFVDFPEFYNMMRGAPTTIGKKKHHKKKEEEEEADG